MRQVCRSEAGWGSQVEVLYLYLCTILRTLPHCPGHTRLSGESIAFLSPLETDTGITEYGEIRQLTFEWRHLVRILYPKPSSPCNRCALELKLHPPRFPGSCPPPPPSQLQTAARIVINIRRKAAKPRQPSS
jgi:hypothetical protein